MPVFKRALRAQACVHDSKFRDAVDRAVASVLLYLVPVRKNELLIAMSVPIFSPSLYDLNY